MSQTDITVDEIRAQSLFLAKSAVALNYNAHKSEKNKTLTLEEVTILALIEGEHKATVMLTTSRNDGLLYEIVFDTINDKVTLHLYNRIARKTLLAAETPKEENA